MIAIAPALIPKSRDDIITFAAAMSFAHEVHIDVVDGLFVPFVSWPYGTNEEPRDVKFILDAYSLEVDLMVQNPLVAADAWFAAGADSLVFHAESLSLSSFITATERYPLSIGISANKATSFSVLADYLPYADYVQIMGIADIGAQGQPFDTYCFDRIDEVRRAFPRMPITIDGSVNAKTIAAIAAHGIDRCVVGSALTRTVDPEVAYRELLNIALQQ